MFFFQAEDGIRDLTVTGVQTCALPISTIDADTLLVPYSLKRAGARMLASPPYTVAVAGAVLVRNSRQNLLTRAQEWDYFLDRKSTRLNSSHSQISYAVFCLKKKKNSYI